MFKPHIGICTACSKERLIVVKKLLCKHCNDERKGKTRRIKKMPRGSSLFSSKVSKSDINRKASRAGKRNSMVDKTGSKSTVNVCKNSKKTGTQEKKKRKPIQYRRKPTGEREVFKKIIQEDREEILDGTIKCKTCHSTIKEVGPSNFSHLLPKSTYPEFRLDPRNIWICCTGCHHDWDFGDRSQKKFAGKRALADALRQESNLLRRTNLK